MTSKKIVYTRYDGGVSICTPTDWIMSVMSCGGLWDDMPRGFMDAQIERQISDGIRADVAARYAGAVQFGGCTTAEALEIIRDRDCAPHGTAIELWDASDVPTDRWFRDAWTRSHNGGPISVSLKLAKPIQLGHIANAIRAENRKREEQLLAPLDIDTVEFRDRVMSAREENELRAIWPKSVALPA